MKSAAPASDIPPPPASVVHALDKTVREVIPPWHLLQDRMKARKENERAEPAVLEMDADDVGELVEVVEAPPPSGVRMSEPPMPVVANDVPPASKRAPATPGPGDESLLTYKVYTVAELEKRSSEAPVALSMRPSLGESTTARAALLAVRARNAFMVFAKALHAWWKTNPLEREPAKKALRQPFDHMGDELEVVVKAIDWRRLGVGTGIAVGATLTLLFTVLTAAELTDDLKTTPRAGGSQMAMEPTGLPPTPSLGGNALTGAGVAAAPMAPPLPTMIVAAPAAPEGTVELDEAAPPPPSAKRAAQAPSAKKPGAGKKKLAFRNADEIFKP